MDPPADHPALRKAVEYAWRRKALVVATAEITQIPIRIILLPMSTASAFPRLTSKIIIAAVQLWRLDRNQRPGCQNLQHRAPWEVRISGGNQRRGALL